MNQTEVHFEAVFEKLNQLLENQKPDLIVILVDENTHEACLPVLLPQIETEVRIEIIEIMAGEQNKNLDFAFHTFESLVDIGAGRKSLLINLGGGMITDFGGFVASVYMRGIPFINIPTSLLGMVDAAIGGKTGLDMNRIKNIVGSYSFPLATLIYTGFLNTLPKREFKSGLAEMLKHGLIYEKSHWNNLIQIENPEPETISAFIKDSVNIKLKIIEKDPYEKGLRKILNFGHTIGHAIESQSLETKNQLLHGEAVAIGMLVESVLSFENELITKVQLNEIFQNIIRIFGKSRIDENKIPDLLKWMGHDKKNEGNQINFSLLTDIGAARFDLIQTKEKIEDALKIYNRLLDND